MVNFWLLVGNFHTSTIPFTSTFLLLPLASTAFIDYLLSAVVDNTQFFFQTLTRTAMSLKKITQKSVSYS
jgi:hypothetical protein